MARQTLAAGAFLLVLATAAAGQTALYSSWIGGPAADRFTGATVLKDGTVILAGTMPNDGDPNKDPKFNQPVKGVGRGEGILIRVAPVSGSIAGLLRISRAVSDMDDDDSGNLYIIGDFGCTRQDQRGRTIWNNDLGGPAARINAGPNGSAIVLSDKTVTVLSPYGTTNKSWKVEADVVADVTCDSSEQLAYVTGYDNKKTASGKTLQVAFVYAYDGGGNIIWKAYGWSAAELEAAGLAADTRGYRVRIGRDHKVYVAGESAGGATLWTRQPQDLSRPVPLAKGDKFQNPTGVGPSVTIGFVGRLDAKTGRSESGTFLLARTPDPAAAAATSTGATPAAAAGKTATAEAADKPAALHPRALSIDDDGRIYLGGFADADPPLSERTFGKHFDGPGAFLVLFDPNFRQLYGAKLCTGQTNAISIGRTGILAVGEGTANLTPLKPLQKEFGGGTSDGWMVFFSPPPLTLPVDPAVTPTVASPPTLPFVPAPTPSMGSVSTPSMGAVSTPTAVKPTSTPTVGAAPSPTAAPVTTPTVPPRPLISD